MDGILLIDKPEDFTSFDVVAKCRGMLGTRKIGHAGTLDPMATGVLPLFVGAATKAIDLLPDTRKRYTATFRLGFTTDTQDITGTVLRQRTVTVDRGDVESALQGFLGEIQQLPPMYSAVKVNGKRLYELARKGVEVERKPRAVTIESIQLLQANQGAGEYTIDVLCTSGTYIRTLCHDLGEQLGCGAVLTALRRTMAAGFVIEDCLTLAEAQRLVGEGTLSHRLLPLDTPFGMLPKIHLDPRREQLLRNGVRITLTEAGEAGTKEVAVYGGGEHFLAVASVDTATGQVLSRKLFEPGGTP